MFCYFVTSSQHSITKFLYIKIIFIFYGIPKTHISLVNFFFVKKSLVFLQIWPLKLGKAPFLNVFLFYNFLRFKLHSCSLCHLIEVVMHSNEAIFSSFFIAATSIFLGQRLCTFYRSLGGLCEWPK